MGAGLAIVAVVGAVLSYVIVQPATLLGSLATLSLSGSAITLAVALLAPARRDREADREEHSAARERERDPAMPPLAPTPVPREHVQPT